MPFLSVFPPFAAPFGQPLKWTTFGYSAPAKHPLAVAPKVDENGNGHVLLDKTLSSSQESLQWDDIFGPSADLTPMLLDIYDALFQQKNGNENRSMSKDLKCRPLSVASSSSSAISSSSSSSLSSFHHPLRHPSYVTRGEEEGDGEGEEEEEEEEEEEDSGVSEVSARRSWCHSRQGQSSGSSSPSTLLRPRYCTDPNLTYTERVAVEIVETERTYVNDLQEIIQGYLNYLKTGCLKVEIGSQNVADLFGNIEDIYKFNKEYLKELELCAFNPASVAKCFVQHKAGFSVYTLYCTNYPRTVSVLTELMRKEETAEIFKVRQTALGHMLPLGSFLLKPVQRILKYHLLLQNMCKHYNKEKGDYDKVVEALSTMTGIAHHINEMKRKHEHAVRVQEIQSLLYGWRGEDLTTYGELIAEGTFHVFGAKGVRHVFLFEKMLLISKKREDISLNYKAHIMCSNLMLIESVAGEPLCFHVVPFDSPRVQYTLQARNLDQKREWSLQLKRVILENYNVDIPSHARELVMQLGQHKTDECLTVERGTASRRAHSAPEYLERRKQEKERRKIDSLNKTLRARRVSHLKNKTIALNEEWRDVDRKNLTFSRKGKKGKGWRRKSEPCDIISSQESLTPSSKAEESISLSNPVAEEPTGENDEYVSFYLPSQNVANSLPTSPTQVIYDVPCNDAFSSLSSIDNVSSNHTSTPVSHYDNLHNLCNCNMLTSTPCSSLTLSDKSSPTEPAVWLKQQQEHLADTSAIKAGSLPRSFQLSNDTPSNNIFKQRHLADRPFTIASDKPSQSDLNLDDFERYIVDSPPVKQQNYRFPVDKEDDDVSGTMSTEDLSASSVHPEHRIYRPSLSRTSLRSLVANLSTRLTGTKISSNDDQEEKLANRLLVTLVQAYSRMTKKSGRSKSLTNGECNEPVVIHRQGSPSIGARMAKPLTNQVDYAVPCIRRPSSSDVSQNGNSRPESLLWLATSPHWISDSVKELNSDLKANLEIEEMQKEEDKVAEEVVEKSHQSLSNMADSYYERSFEAIDTLSDSTGTCSDEAEDEPAPLQKQLIEEEDEKITNEGQQDQVQEEEQSKEETQSPLRVKGSSILETMKNLEECCKKYQTSNRDQVTAFKPIRERCRALEEITASPIHSPSCNSVSSPNLDVEVGSTPVTMGWVKQVIEKFQK